VNTPVGSAPTRLAVALAYLFASAALAASPTVAPPLVVPPPIIAPPVVGPPTVVQPFVAAPLDVLRDCSATVSAVLTGLRDLNAACPQLGAALAQLGLDKILYAGWQDKLTAHGLQDAAELAQRYSGSERHLSLDSGVLRGILESYNSQPQPRVSWWRSLEDWFKDWLAHSNSALANLLNRFWDRWLSHVEVPPSFLKVFAYVLTALVVLAGIVVLIRELNAVGRARRGDAAAGKKVRDVGYGLDTAGDGSPIGSGVAELLRALVQRLLQSGRLQEERSLTHRELIARSAFDSEAQRGVFASVARTAESVLYGPLDGPQAAAPQELEQVTRQGRALLIQLSNSAGAP
jgi:hypothetical protein